MQSTNRLCDTDAKADLCKRRTEIFLSHSEMGGSSGQRFQTHKKLLCVVFMKVNVPLIIHIEKT